MRPHEELVEEASDHTITSSRLREIYEMNRSKARVMRAIVGNPNTPPDIFIELLPEHVEEFCRNPVAPLLLVENPNFIQGISHAWPLLLRCENLPQAYLQMFLEIPETCEEAAMHVAHKGEVQEGEDWKGYTGKQVTKEIEQMVGHRELLNILFTFGLIPAFFQPYFSRPSATTQKRHRTTYLPSTLKENLRWKELRQSPPEPDETMLLNIPTGDDELQSLLENPRIPSYFLAEIAESVLHGGLPARGDILLKIARNPQASQETLHRLYSETKEVLSHPNCPPELLAWEAKAKGRKRHLDTVALHPHTPYETLTTLAATEGGGVNRMAQFALFVHPETPEEIRRQIVLVDIGNTLRGNRGGRCLILCQTPDARQLRQACRDDDWCVRAAAALHPMLRDEKIIERDWIEQLQRDGNRYVRAAARLSL
jgi:hypothetical protein